MHVRLYSLAPPVNVPKVLYSGCEIQSSCSMMKGTEIYPGLYDIGIFRCTFMVGFIKNKALVCSEDSCVSTDHCEILMPSNGSLNVKFLV